MRPNLFCLLPGRAGTVAQIQGFAQALGGTCISIYFRDNAPWQKLPTAWWCPIAGWTLKPEDRKKLEAACKGPEPVFVISAGRRGGALNAWIKKRYPQVIAVHIQNIDLPFRYFDWVLPLAHDTFLPGPFVCPTRTALHRITPEGLTKARQQWLPVFRAYPAPRVALLLGGANRFFKMDVAWVRKLIQQLELQLKTHCFLVTCSRRTPLPAKKQLEKWAKTHSDRIYLWDGTGENPYVGLLSIADIILCSADSISMISEACATETPVYLLPTSGKSKKFERFYIALGERVRWFEKTLAPFSVKAINDVAAVVEKIRTHLTRKSR